MPFFFVFSFSFAGADGFCTLIQGIAGLQVELCEVPLSLPH